MPYCIKCGNEINNAGNCDECGYNDIVSNRDIISTDDTGGFGYFILGAIFPMVGLILFIVWNNTKPKSAKAAGLGALLLFPMIFFMGIIAAFAVPAIGQIIENTNKSMIYADALAVEQAANIYCLDILCDDNQSLTWTQLQANIEDIDTTYYDVTNNSGIIATKTASGWTIDLEAVGTGEWEFTQGSIPSAGNRDFVVCDLD